MKKFFINNRDLGILAMRLGIGCAFTFIFGMMKVKAGPEMWGMIGGALGNFGITFAPTFWGFMATMSEFAGGILLILGLFVRPAAFFMAFTMIVAATTHFSMHDQWYNAIQPIEMLSIFIAFMFLGAGKYSLDYLFFKRNKTQSNI